MNINLLSQAPLQRDLLEILEAGSYEAPDEPLQPGEIPVGSMNEYEHALFTLSQRYIAEGHALVEQVTHDGVYIGPFDHEAEYMLKVMQLKRLVEATNSLMWLSINERFAKQLEPDEVSGTGVRRGGIIVMLPKDNSTTPKIQIKVVRLDETSESVGARIRRLLFNN